MSTAAWGALHLAVFSAIYLYGLFAALLRRIASSRRTAATRDDLRGISALKPMAGLDPFLEENLQSFARLDMPDDFEVLLLVDTPDDAAASVARKMIDKYPQRFRLIVGKVAGLSNPKVASVAYGVRFAKNPFIWMTDSNVETSDAHVRDLVTTWKHAQKDGPLPTLVHAPIAAVKGSGLGASFERIHLAPYTQSNYELCLIAGVHVVVGKSLFVRADHLRLAGGLESFGHYSGEDYFLGVKFKQLGAARVSQNAAHQRLGEHVPMSGWLRRQIRWAIVRRPSTGPSYYFGEPFTYLALSLIPALLGVLPWSWLGGALLMKLVGDSILHRVYCGVWPKAIDLLVLPCKEIVLVAGWLAGFQSREITWRGRRLLVQKGSVYQEPAA